MSFIFTGNTISFQVSSIGAFTTVNSDAPNFDKVVELVRLGKMEEAYTLSNLRASVTKAIEGTRVVLNGNDLYYNGEIVKGLIGQRIIEMFRLGFSISPLLEFLYNLKQNPSKRAVDELYGFLEVSKLPITEDGHFLAYKSVTHDFKDLHSRTFDNSVGSICKMPRNGVDEDKDRTCSAGLHFAAHEYASGFGGHGCKMVVLKINPRDVVAIPSDYNNQKGRCCEYLVLEEVTRDDTKLVGASFVPSKPALPKAEAKPVYVPNESNYRDDKFWYSNAQDTKRYFYEEAKDFPVNRDVPYTLTRVIDGKKYKGFYFTAYDAKHDNLVFRKPIAQTNTFQYCTIATVDNWDISVKEKNIR